MATFDPILHEHEKRLAVLETARRKLEDSMIVMAELERPQSSRTEAMDELLAAQTQSLIDQKRWKTQHELAMKEFDDKLNGLIAWLDDFVRAKS